MPSFQQSMGIGRGMIANNVSVAAPNIPGPHYGQGDSDTEGLAPLRLPGQSASTAPKHQYQPQQASQFTDAEQTTVTNGRSYLPGEV